MYVAHTADLLREAAALDAARPTGIAADGWEPLMTSTTVLRATLDLQVVTCVALLVQTLTGKSLAFPDGAELYAEVGCL